MAADNTTPQMTPEEQARLTEKLAPSKELLKTQPLAENGPGAGGWVPKPSTLVLISVFCGIAGSAAPVLMQPTVTWNVLLASVLSGAATALVGYFGMRSAGPRQS